MAITKPAWRSTFLPVPLPFSSSPPRRSPIRRVLCPISLPALETWKPNLGFWVLFLSDFDFMSVRAGSHYFASIYACLCLWFFCVLSAPACTDRRSPRGIRCDTWMGLLAVWLSVRFVMYRLHLGCTRRAYVHLWDLIPGVWVYLLETEAIPPSSWETANTRSGGVDEQDNGHPSSQELVPKVDVTALLPNLILQPL